MEKSHKHYSVLKTEVIENLAIKPNGIYVDATLGRGGHSEAILSKLSSDGLLISLDQDEEAIKYCQEKFKNFKNIKLIKANFADLKKVLTELNISHIDGIIADLGVSSPQLDNIERGFSYKKDAKLDMRMDQSQMVSAYEVLNQYSKEQLIKIFQIYGDIRNPQKLVNKIISDRVNEPIETTKQFYNLIKESTPAKIFYASHNFANNYFQAIRIEVNQEIEALNKLLEQIPDVLNKNGIACLISFHSLEDKLIVKAFKALTNDHLPKEVPIQNYSKNFILIKPKGITPSKQELVENSRSHSAKLRIIQKIIPIN